MRISSSTVYFLLTFAISWGIVIAAVGWRGFPGSPEEQETQIGAVVGGLVAGPVVSALIMLWMKRRFKDLFFRLFKWKVNILWYVVAILSAPLCCFLTLLVLMFWNPKEFKWGVVQTEDPKSLVQTGLLIGFVGGVAEEIGWTGFAIPELRKRFGKVKTGLIVGFIWGMWHYITAYWGSGDDEGNLVMSKFAAMMLFYVAVLPVYRVLMMLVYEKTESLLIAILMHASLTGNVLFVFMPLEISDLGLIYWYSLLCLAFGCFVVMWIVFEKNK